MTKSIRKIPSSFLLVLILNPGAPPGADVLLVSAASFQSRNDLKTAVDDYCDEDTNASSTHG